MNASDLARLELAKRAFRAAEPNATEVQRGVRRARLSLQRPKARRRWFSKGAVMLVLAAGGLAYAKPHALSDFVASTLVTHDTSTEGTTRATGAAVLTPPHEPAVAISHANERGPQAGVVPATEPAPAPVPAPGAQPAPASVDGPARSIARVKVASAPQVTAGASAAREAPRLPPAGDAADARTSTGASRQAPTSADAVSDWGRVAQALAQGDEGKALSALSTLSESADQRTRDKADIGRAQLFMANGDREGACALARDLTRRHAGGRIDRQAQAILKSCLR